MSLEDSQLLLFVLLNAVVFFNAVCLTCLLGGWRTWAERLLDCFLYFVTLVVTGFLVLHFLHRITLDGLCVLHVGAALLLGWLARRRGWDIRGFFTLEPIRRLGWTGQVLVCLFAAWFCAYAFYCRYLPSRATDPLVYHLTKPAQWLKTGDLSLVPMLFAEPDVCYGPIDGELMLLWWMAPFGNEVLARFGQMPFYGIMALALYNVWRGWRLSQPLALGCAGVVLLFRPFLREIVIPNNDLMLSAALLTFVSEWQRFDGQWRGWARGGLVLGMMAGTKVTGLIYLGPCLGLIAARAWWVRRSLRRGEIIVGCACLGAGLCALGGFSYFRNWGLTGNPLFPAIVKLGGKTIFPGVFDSDSLAGLHFNGRSAFDLLFSPHTTFGMLPLTSWIWGASTVASTVVCLARRKRNEAREFLAVCLLMGATYLCFLYKVPYLEQRLIFPIYAAGLLALGCLLERIVATGGVWLGVAGLAGIGVCFGLESVQLRSVPWLALGATIVLVFLLRLWLAADARLAGIRRLLMIGGGIALIILAALALWPPFLRTYQAVKYQLYRGVWPQEAEAWIWLNEHTRNHPASIAYTGEAYVYPLLGQDLQNSVFYVPVGTTPQSFLHELHCPPATHVDSDMAFRMFVERAARGHPDENAWLGRIIASHANVLFIYHNPGHALVEMHWADSHAELFHKVFARGSVTIYLIGMDSEPGHKS